MTIRTEPPIPDRLPATITTPRPAAILAAVAIALAFVALTRLPVARATASDFDEVGYLATIRDARFPMHHTLFLAAGRVIGDAVDDPYRGFVLLDSGISALALVAVWWWLRALVAHRTAAAAALALGCAPLFWAYGAMAGNYTMVPLVGSVLLGIAARGPRPWHPFAAAVVLALGAGYRQDIGVFWLPVFAVILWRHRWMAAAQAGLLFVALNLAWFVPMLAEAGGWSSYREASAEFAHSAGYLNSVAHLGLIDAPVRYAAKLALALGWTFGPGLLAVPIGVWALRRAEGGRAVLGLLALSVAPALASHLLVHFGVPGYAFHYVPALVALLALGLESIPGRDRAGVALAVGLAAVFLLYRVDYDRPAGVRRDLDLCITRYCRTGLRTPTPVRDPIAWRTPNSQELPGESGRRTDAPRRSLSELWAP